MLAKVLSIIQSISKVISENVDRQYILDEITSILAQNLDSEVCSIYLYDDKEDELVLKATFGLNKESIDSIRLKPGSGITGFSFKYNEIINVAPPEKHPKYVFFKGSGEEKFRSFLSVPLVAGGHCVGVLNLQRMMEKRFSPSIVDVVKSVCTQVANLIIASQMLKVLSNYKKAVQPMVSTDKKQISVKGVSACGGIAEGRAVIFERYDYFGEISPGSVKSVSKELLLLEFALKTAKKETVELENHAMKMISEADSSIFNVHVLFLEDKTLVDAIRRKITDENYSLEYAIKLVNDEYQIKFSQFKDPVFREKASDLKDVLLRLLAIIKSLRGDEKKIKGHKPIENQIVVTSELLPSDIMRLPLDKVVGIVCEKGGVTAHIAILAKALNMPLLMGAAGVLKEIGEEDELILDCHAELVYISPSPAIKRQYAEIMRNAPKIRKDVDREPAFTSDGAKITVRANISLVSEASMLSHYGAEGIGLYRTEFLFMIRDHLPPEEIQTGVYAKIVKSAKGDPVTIRVLDIGADKPLSYFNLPAEINPALGWRGIRVLLAKREVLKSQLSAILKVSVNSNIKILFPMVSVTSELIEIKQVLAEVEFELHAKKIPHNEHYQTGIMLEVPSAVIAIDELLKDVDFMSIGSNDLLMYTFAADRGNEYVASLIKPLHPAFLKLLRQIGSTFEKYPNKGLALCGEMASTPYSVPFLIGAGIREFSMSVSHIAAIKKAIRAFSVDECREMIDMAISFNNTESVLCLVRQAFMDKGLS